MVWDCLDACAQSYAPASSATLLSSPLTDTHALVVTHPQGCLVAFRGTADLRNLVTDLDCPLVPFNSTPHPPRVHAGFWRAWLSIKSELLEFLQTSPSQKIILTGHSLGGAIAQLAAFDLTLHSPSTALDPIPNPVNPVNPVKNSNASNPPPPPPPTALANPIQIQSCLTFGQPRVGNPGFALLYNATLRPRTWRFVHSDDPIPRLPWLLGSYRHAGHEAYITKSNQIHFDPSILSKLPSDLAAAARSVASGRISPLQNHHLHTYMNTLAATPASSWPAVTWTSPRQAAR